MSVDLNIRAIKIRMAETGLNGTQLAQKTKISRQSISTILRRGSCSMRSARELAYALEMDMDTMIKED